MINALIWFFCSDLKIRGDEELESHRFSNLPHAILPLNLLTINKRAEEIEGAQSKKMRQNTVYKINEGLAV